MDTSTIIVITVIAITLVAIIAIGTRFVAFVINVSIQADKEKSSTLEKLVAAQQAQIDTLKCELEEMKQKQ